MVDPQVDREVVVKLEAGLVCCRGPIIKGQTYINFVERAAGYVSEATVPEMCVTV